MKHLPGGSLASATRNGKKPEKKPVARKISPKGGGVLVPGNPGNRGGNSKSGRKPDAFKAACEGLADDVVLTKVTAYLERKDTNPDDPWWWKCAEYVTQYGKGKPAQSVTLAQDEDAPPFRFTLNLGEAAIHEGDDE